MVEPIQDCTLTTAVWHPISMQTHGNCNGQRVDNWQHGLLGDAQGEGLLATPPARSASEPPRNKASALELEAVARPYCMQ